jgi:threonine synthase
VEAAQALGWYCRNTGYNPFTAEGKKTAALEMCEQLTIARHSTNTSFASWEVPDTVFTSVGDGNIISGLHKGFKDLYALGWIEKIPKLFGVQSKGSAAIYNAFHAETEKIVAVKADTIADSISVDLPRDGLRALRAATQTGGAYISVSDEAILTAIRDLAKVEGIFAEPAGATSYAGVVKAVELDLIDVEENHLILVTGSGLKDVSAAMKAVGEPEVIKPSLNALQLALEKDKEQHV